MCSTSASQPPRPLSTRSQPRTFWLVSTDAVFVIDLRSARLTRVTGIEPPRSGQAPDGASRAYRSLSVERDGHTIQVDIPTAGDSSTVIWADGLAPLDMGRIVVVSDRPAWNGPYQLAAPIALPGVPTFVLSGEEVVGACATQAGALTMAALLTIALFENPTSIAASKVRVCNGEASTPICPAEPWRRPWSEPPRLLLDALDGGARQDHPRTLHVVHD